MASFSDSFGSILSELLMESDDASFEFLTDALCELQTKSPRSYADLKKQPFARKVFEAIEEARSYKIHMQGKCKEQHCQICEEFGDSSEEVCPRCKIAIRPNGDHSCGDCGRKV